VVVEDNPPDVLLLKETLKHRQIAFMLEHYANGEDAAKAFRSMTRVPDLILLDLNVPRVNGFELLVLIRRHPVLSQAKVAVFTSSRLPGDKIQSEQLGADAFITKPLGLQEFLGTVGAAIAKLLDAGAAGSRRSRARGCDHNRPRGPEGGSALGGRRFSRPRRDSRIGCVRLGATIY